MNRIAQYKNTAKRSFEIIDRLLSVLGDGERNNYQLARYYNVLASYYEWEGEFEQALNTYDKGLKIPEVEESLISSLLVNIGIIYRMVGKLKSDPQESIYFLRKGVEYNGEGAHAKEVIGNEDQLPIALHNLAETYIELACRLQPGNEKNHSLQQAYRHSQLGLDINKRIHSTKKLGQLLCERFLSVYWLEKLGVAMFDNQADVQQQLFDWVKQMTATSGYDVDVVLDLMLRTDDFAGSSLEELAEWLA
jgi:tetratricopeptide (TPR) repeat protein